MTVRLFLSPLTTEGGTLRRPSAGRWYPAPDFLDQYSADILVERTSGTHSPVRGVPTVFAQPIYFWQALRDRNHPSFLSAQRQWRGILACFALQDWLKLPIHVQRFRLERREGWDPEADDVLRGIFEAHLPEPKEEWTDWWLVRCNEVLIGASSPWTLFYPAAQTEVIPAIPWQRAGSLIDPIEHFDGKKQNRNSVELELLADWVEYMVASQSDRWWASREATWDATLAVIAEALEAWRGDLRPYRRAARVSAVVSLTHFQEVPTPYRSFMRPIEANGIQPAGELLLETPRGEKYVVLKREGLDPLRRVYSGVFVSEIDLPALPAEGPGPWTTKAGRTIPFPFIVAEDVLLTRKLAELPVSNAGIGLQCGEQNFALPLTSLALRYFSYQAIRERKVKVELRNSDGAVEARLSFELLDGSVFQVLRLYDRRKDVIELGPDAPALAIWPNFYSDDWNQSTAIFVNPEGVLPGIKLTAAPIAGDATLLQRSPVEKERRPWVAWQSHTPLLGFEIYDESSGRVEPCGLILRAESRRPAHSDKGLKWGIAVDFGTSNTLTMKRSGDTAPELLSINPRTVLLTRNTGAAAEQANSAFYPLDGTVKGPFPTILVKDHGYSVNGDAGAVPGQLYSPRYSPDLPIDTESIVQDLKWSRSGGGRSDLPIRAYLQILVRALIAEAIDSGVSKVTLHWSYPLSLPEAPLQAMRNFWQTVPAEFSAGSITVEVAEEGGRSESEAMSRYFAGVQGGLPVRAEGLSIAVDIGGGSTDAGFWSAQRFLDQFSFKLAGNDLLVPPAMSLDAFLSDLADLCAVSKKGKGGASSGIASTNRTEVAIKINSLLSEGGARVPQALHGRLPAGEKPWSVVRTAIYLFFGGLSYYLGLHSRKSSGGVARKQDFAVLFGGKASGLLLWLSNEYRQLQSFLINMFIEGLAYDDATRRASTVIFYGPGLEPVPSTIPKAEVAHGLLLDPLKGERPVAVGTTAVGEIGWRSLIIAAEPLTWDTEVDLNSLSTLRAPDNLQTGFAATFVDTLVPRFARDFALDLAGLEDLKLTIPEVEDAVRRLADEKVLQPVFGSELRLIIGKYFEGAGIRC
jgi:hypothetical protein